MAWWMWGLIVWAAALVPVASLIGRRLRRVSRSYPIRVVDRG